MLNKPRKITMKILVEYNDYLYESGDELREDYEGLLYYIKQWDNGSTVTCLSIERDGERVLD